MTVEKLTYANSQPTTQEGALNVKGEHFNPAVEQINTNTTAITALGSRATALEAVATNFTGSKTSKEYVAEVAVSSTDFKTASTAALTLLAAPGAGKFYEVLGIVVKYTYSTAQYTGGGNVTLTSGSTAITAAVANTVINGWAADAAYVIPVAVHAPTINGAIKLAVASANFGTGAGSFVITLTYRIHTM